MTRKLAFVAALAVVISLGIATGSRVYNNPHFLLIHAAHKLRVAPQVMTAYSAWRAGNHFEFTLVSEESAFDAATGALKEFHYRRTQAQRKDGATVYMTTQYPAGKGRAEGPATNRRDIHYPDGSTVRTFDEFGYRTSYPAYWGPSHWWGGRPSEASDCTSRNESFLVDGKRDTIFHNIGQNVLAGLPVVVNERRKGDTVFMSPYFGCIVVATKLTVHEVPAGGSIELRLIDFKTPEELYPQTRREPRGAIV